MSRAKANPNPMMMPYPKPWDKGAVKVVSPAAISEYKPLAEGTPVSRINRKTSV